MVSDVPGARALERAHAAGIPTAVFPSGDYATREEHDLAMAQAIREAGADLVVLAGYMRLVSPAFVRAFPSRIINLHPALLPAFPGTTSIGDAVGYGVKVTGVTVHFVDEGLDTGPVIAQEPVRVEHGDTAESLAARIHAVEHRAVTGHDPAHRSRQGQAAASRNPGRPGRLERLRLRSCEGHERWAGAMRRDDVSKEL